MTAISSPEPGRILIVTGASRGIGAATARMAARRGYAVCVNYSQDRDGAEAVAAVIEADGGQAMPVQADTSDEAAVAAIRSIVWAAVRAVTSGMMPAASRALAASRSLASTGSSWGWPSRGSTSSTQARLP